ncbi:MAG: phosphoribosylamine--glycine ligase [Ignavibacteria bacterium]|jgi:phosphoribosylamine--glycine ligase|nr:phosphoribosylamine--glycine ligase [Ignavibacteria bacterium]MCU7505105.1 phosphoribosylamine--glycine ligase [Ignavibacteria bacterium]MCU7518063.1 phosphoribosylamine--glycine ligase [Ignavibacteria bacterium]
MHVVVIGSGGREHAISYKIKESKALRRLYNIPGNPGTDTLGENISLDVSSQKELLQFCKDNTVDLVVIGPEVPLMEGLADTLRLGGINVFGPQANAAVIEGDKAFAKNFMKKYNIPTADFVVFDKKDYGSAKEYLGKVKFPVVVKACGLAAGKGVLICKDRQEAESALRECFETSSFGSAGDRIVIEEFMTGQEASVFAITDGENFICLPAAQDHKRIGDNDTGKNTGGMGAYAPAPIVTPEIQEEIERKIISPVLKGMKAEGRPFSGCLYCGLMLTEEGPRVVEFNCRFGDPETQAVLPVLEGDFLLLLYSAARGNLDKNAVKYSGGSAVCVVAVSSGYPESYRKGFEISGLEHEEDGVIVFHAGTKKDSDKVVTNGGRVLGVTAFLNKNDLKACKEKAYKALENIHFENIFFRKDIADKAIGKIPSKF